MPFLWAVKKIATTLLQWPLYLNVPFYPYLIKGKTAREKSLTPDSYREKAFVFYKVKEYSSTGHIMLMYYIIPGIPPPPIGGIAGIPPSSSSSVITHSVVNNIAAIEAAFSNAILETLVGSITPALNKSS